MTLPGLAPRQPRGGDEPAEAVLPEPEPTDEGQLDLFADKVVLERDVDVAIFSGRIVEARRQRDRHRETYGPSAGTAGLDFLDDVLEPDGSSSPAEVLAAWAAVDRSLATRPALRGRLRDGILRRLLALHTAEALVAAHPPCLGPLAGLLTAEARAAGGASSPAARRLARDALLDGRELTALDFAEDARLADLLAEPLASPRWLACLGAIVRLWPVPPLGGPEVDRFDDEDVMATGDEALGFWLCLRVVSAANCPERVLREARRWMKTLSAPLHAEYMRRASR